MCVFVFDLAPKVHLDHQDLPALLVDAEQQVPVHPLQHRYFVFCVGVFALPRCGLRLTSVSSVACTELIRSDSQVVEGDVLAVGKLDLHELRILGGSRIVQREAEVFLFPFSKNSSSPGASPTRNRSGTPCRRSSQRRTALPPVTSTAQHLQLRSPLPSTATPSPRWQGLVSRCLSGRSSSCCRFGGPCKCSSLLSARRPS